MPEPSARTPPVERFFSQNLECVPQAANEARCLAAAALNEWDLTQLLDDVRLVMTELVSNAVAHAAGSGVLVSIVLLDEQRVRINVLDQDRKRPEPRPLDVEQERGRGLLLVQVLASLWGVDLLPGGKSVWAELEVPT
ncbi:MAG: ATP-binding protein [Streptomyces sp.]|nr:ATP-binding protein [Streptomyces sp.]